MSYKFATTTHGKWILTGEHAVLRGHQALVFPLKHYQLTLTYKSSDTELTADCNGTHGADMNLLFWSVLQQGQKLLGQSLNNLHGHFHIDNNIPIGVGMGASAALCVAMARWFTDQELIAVEKTAEFARHLEDLFHGQSSGLDIAGVAADAGIHFQQRQIKPIQQTWQPCWYLSSCEQLGITSHCINQVKQLWQTNAKRAEELDNLMNQATIKAHHALESTSPSAIGLLTEAIQEGAHCFAEWGLISETLSQHMQLLYHHGALAVKPTGSGNGGFVLSLWANPPPPLRVDLITLY